MIKERAPRSDRYVEVHRHGAESFGLVMMRARSRSGITYEYGAYVTDQQVAERRRTFLRGLNVDQLVPVCEWE